LPTPRFNRLLAVAALFVSLAAPAGGQGIVVEEVGPGSALETAGLRAGDLVAAWERPPAQGEIRTFFDWLAVKTEQAPRGMVRLRGVRDGAAIALEVPQGVWDARVRPGMTADLLPAYTTGRQRIAAGDLEGGVAVWNELAQRADPGLRGWLRLRVGEALAQGRQADEARAVWQAAATETADAQARVALLEALGESYLYGNEMAHAEASLRSALEVGEAAWGDSLRVAGTLARLGLVVRRQNRLDPAQQLEDRAMEIRQRLAPDSLEVADSLHQLCGLAGARGDVPASAQLSQKALAILERRAPDSLQMAEVLSDTSQWLSSQGRYDEAIAALQHAREILEKRSPGSLQMATILGNLGSMSRQRGDLEGAEELHRSALAIREKRAPQSLGTAVSLSVLGQIARDRGELATATELFHRAMAVWGKAAPEGLGVAGNLDELGNVAQMQGDLSAAWDLYHRALKILDRLSPDSLEVADILSNLGAIAEARGEPGSAQSFYLRADGIYARLSPGTIDQALALQGLGRLQRRAHRLDAAAQLLHRAVEALESQVGRLGGSRDLQATYRARYEGIYHDAVEIEIERGHDAAAFYLVERSRARGFLALLAERDLALSGELPAALERSRRDNAARYDQKLHELSLWAPAAGDAARQTLLRELSRLRREREDIAAAVRKASPRLAALREPQPLDLAAARQALDPGTLALSYSVGAERTALFALTREGKLRVKVLPLGEPQLRRDVEHFLEQIRTQESPEDLARSLYRALIAPVADLVGTSRRLLILPDGPLHRLPFGALLRDTPGRGQLLTEWRPLHSALSLTVYGALRAARDGASRTGKPARLVAFADPRYPRETAPDGEPGAARRNSLEPHKLTWAPLPYSRSEVERSAEAYPAARLYLGEEATEEQAKAIHDAPILHFATHGYLDDRTPLDSALVLSIPEKLSPGRDNGLLQVWEIFESVRLDSDLVVLSACESALGRELSGEGLIGLTRAFQYAGARSVIASLWDVPDQTTAELMARLHHHLAAGLPKDQALRAAQMELIRKPVRITTAAGQTLETGTSAPFFWAAFQLFGDWR
jgi:CHAT domain-containing protein